MNDSISQLTQAQPKGPSFDLVRLTKSKREVDLSPNTIRSYAQQGLNLYKCGRAVFFSRFELEGFIRGSARKQAA